MGACLCISDLHLSEARPATTRAFRQFLLREAPHTHSLYILGDLFDLWIGDDDDSPLAREIAASLNSFTASGARLFLMPGNRDFLLGEAFAARCGATLLADFSVVELAGTATLLSHGDALCTDDHEYQQFRSRVQAPDWRASFLSLPLEQRRIQALELRAKSEQAKSGKSSALMDVNAGAVAAALEKYGVARLVHGHTHRPGRYPLQIQIKGSSLPSERLALDQWESCGTYLCVDSNLLELRTFSY